MNISKFNLTTIKNLYLKKRVQDNSSFDNSEYSLIMSFKKY